MKKLLGIIILSICINSCTSISEINPAIVFAPDSNVVSIMFDSVFINTGKSHKEEQMQVYFTLPLPVRKTADSLLVNQLRIAIMKDKKQAASFEFKIGKEWHTYNFPKGIELFRDCTLSFNERVELNKSVKCEIKIKSDANMVQVDSWDIGKLK